MDQWVKDIYFHICRQKININYLYVRIERKTGKFVLAGHNTDGPWAIHTHSIVRLKDALKRLDKS